MSTNRKPLSAIPIVYVQMVAGRLYSAHDVDAFEAAKARGFDVSSYKPYVLLDSAAAPAGGAEPIADASPRGFKAWAQQATHADRTPPGSNLWDSTSVYEKSLMLKAWQAAPTQPQPQPEELRVDFTDTGRAALLWVLWHHQGHNSPQGQPIRFALGMGRDDRMTDDQIAEAKRWAALSRSTTEEFHRLSGAEPEGTRICPKTDVQCGRMPCDACPRITQPATELSAAADSLIDAVAAAQDFVDAQPEAPAEPSTSNKLHEANHGSL
jgi:hypothetical protein